MSKRGQWISFNSFSEGERSDLPPHIIPDSALLKASNVVTDKVGRLAKRGPVSPYTTNPSTVVIDSVGVPSTVANNSGVGFGYGVGGSQWYTFGLPSPPSINRAGSLNGPNTFTSASQTIPMFQPRWGPSFNSFGVSVFPLISGSTAAPFVGFSRAESNTYSFSSSGTVNMTADNSSVSITVSGLSLSPVHIGHFIYVNDSSSSATKEYIGLITSVSSTTSVTVYPAPKQSISGASCSVRIYPFVTITGSLTESGGRKNVPASTTFGCVHQNRVVAVVNSTISGNTVVDTQRNVISWSSVTGEPDTAANTSADGMLAFLYAGWPRSQQLVLDTAGVTAVVSLDANNLLVLCVDKVLLIAGVLGTIVPSGGVDESSFNIRTVSAEIGCIDPESVQKTPVGVMFAGRDGVYVTDGATFKNVMEGKVQSKWNVYNRSNNSSGNSVVGSAVLKDTHYVVFTENGPNFICDIYNDFSWTELSFEGSVALVASSPQISSIISGDIYVKSGVSPTQYVTENIGQAIDSTTTGDRIVSWRNFYSSLLGDRDQLVIYKNNGTTEYSDYQVESAISVTPAISDVGIDGSGIVACFGRASLNSVSVYTRSGTTWSLASTFSGSAGTNYGFSVAVAKGSGNRIVVGAPDDSSTGRAYVWVFSGGSWTLEATLSNASGLKYGSSVDIDSAGSTIVVGSPRTNTDRGAVYVYTRSGSTWSLVSTLTVVDAPGSPKLGTATAISPNGDLIVTGGQGSNGVGVCTVWSYNGSWTLKSRLDSPISGSNFGTAVDCTSTNFLVGASGVNASYFYTIASGNTEYVSEQLGSAGSSFGQSVVLSDNGQAMFSGAPNF